MLRRRLSSSGRSLMHVRRELVIPLLLQSGFSRCHTPPSFRQCLHIFLVGSLRLSLLLPGLICLLSSSGWAVLPGVVLYCFCRLVYHTPCTSVPCLFIERLPGSQNFCNVDGFGGTLQPCRWDSAHGLWFSSVSTPFWYHRLVWPCASLDGMVELIVALLPFPRRSDVMGCASPHLWSLHRCSKWCQCVTHVDHTTGSRPRAVWFVTHFDLLLLWYLRHPRPKQSPHIPLHPPPCPLVRPSFARISLFAQLLRPTWKPKNQQRRCSWLVCYRVWLMHTPHGRIWNFKTPDYDYT